MFTTNDANGMNVNNMPGMSGPGTTPGGMNSALAVAAAAAAQLNLNLNYQQQQAAAAAVVAANSGPGSIGGGGGGGGNNQNNLTIGDLAANINTVGNNSGQVNGDACLFCNKPLSNLNDFNKKMHLENCKIRKSLEGNVTPKSKKDDPTSSSSSKSNSASHLDTIDLGPQCMYCSRSFANLSNFNKRLHFEHCKVKKRKMRQSMPGETPTPTTPTPQPAPNHQQHSHQSMYSTNPNNSMLSLNNSNSNSPLNLSLLTSHHHHHHHGHQHQSQSSAAQLNNHHHSLFKQPSSSNFHANNANSFAAINNNNNNNTASQQSAASASAANSGEFGDTCLFCARSLLNLSNFNKRVHIETCKIKQLKKETANRLKQINKTIKKKPVVKKDKPSMNSL